MGGQFLYSVRHDTEGSSLVWCAVIRSSLQGEKLVSYGSNYRSRSQEIKEVGYHGKGTLALSKRSKWPKVPRVSHVFGTLPNLDWNSLLPQGFCFHSPRDLYDVGTIPQINLPHLYCFVPHSVMDPLLWCFYSLKQSCHHWSSFSSFGLLSYTLFSSRFWVMKWIYLPPLVLSSQTC